MGVNVVSGTSLDIDASFSAFGITAALSDFNISFATLTATVSDADFSIGTATKHLAFSVGADVSCSGYVPSLAMTSLTVGDEHPGFRDFIEDVDINAALRDAIDQAVDDIVADTELTWPYYSITAITIEGRTSSFIRRVTSPSTCH